MTTSPGAPRHPRDELVIDMLAQSELALRERVRSLEDDLACYRELVAAALSALRDVTVQRDRATVMLQIVRDDFRQFRERLMRNESEAA